MLLLQLGLLVAGGAGWQHIEGSRGANQERPGPVAMSPVLLLQLGIRVAGGAGQQHIEGRR